MSSAGLVLAAFALLVAIVSLILVLRVRAVSQQRGRVHRQPATPILGPSREEVSQMIQIPTGDLIRAAKNHEARLSKLERDVQSLNDVLEEMRSKSASVATQPVVQPAAARSRGFLPQLAPADVATLRTAVDEEYRRADKLASTLEASEAVVGGAAAARRELENVVEDGQNHLRTLDSTMAFLREADANPDAAALRESDVIARYEALGGDPAGSMKTRVDAVVRDFVIGVLNALWSRAQDDRDLGQLLGQLRDAASVELIEPRPGEQFDGHRQDLFGYVPGGNAEKISRTMKPGVLFRGEVVSKPSVKVFQGV